MPAALLRAVAAHRAAVAPAIVRELAAYVAQPNQVHRPEEVRATAAHVAGLLRARGLAVELWPTSSGRPLVFAELAAPAPDAPTLLLYSHYDGVAADPAQWTSPPFEPVLRTPAGEPIDLAALPAAPDPDWRLFGRSVADSKNATVALLAALDALAAAGARPAVGLKLLLDGAEEMESPGLPEALAERRDRLAADLMVSASGERHQSGRPTVALGTRGIVTVALTAHTGAVDAHSGHFGGFAPNAALRLAEALACLHGPDGAVRVAGFEDDVLPLEPDAERAIAAVPAIEGTVADELAIAAPARPQPLQELINRPWLNVRGVAAGAIGPTAANVIPSRADAELDVRLVAGMDPQRTFAALRAHLAAEGWTVLDRPPTRAELRRHPRLLELRMLAGFPAARTPFADPLARTLIDCARRVAPGLVVEPTEGGSVPLHLFAALGIPVATLPTSNHDCNQHAADENLRLGDLFEAVDLFASVLLWDGGA